MDEFDVYITYLSIQQHFKRENYDAVKYRFKVGASTNAYDKRRDRGLFRALLKKYPKQPDLVRALSISMFNGHTYVAEILGDEILHKEFQRRIESLEYIFSQELDYVLEEYGTIAKAVSKDGTSPLYIDVLGGRFSALSAIVLDRLTDWFDLVTKYTTVDPHYSDFVMKHRKLGRLVDVDILKTRKILLDKLNQIA